MNIEFHYYINYLLCVEAGFNVHDALKIVYSSQYVDNNTKQYCIKDNDSIYSNILTQSYNPNLSLEEMMTIYPIFHFIPSDDAEIANKRRDGAIRYTVTSPNCKIAREALIKALQTTNLYLIGIASHAFADTWAHQNFTGFCDHYNCVYENTVSDNYIDDHLYDIWPQEYYIASDYQINFNVNTYLGHFDVIHFPDIINQIWYDYRLINSKINNVARTIEAAKNLFLLYSYSLQGQSYIAKKAINKRWHELKFKLLDIINITSKTTRINMYLSFAEELNQGLLLPPYNQDTWFKQAVIKNNGSLHWKKNKYSDWYFFQEASRLYQNMIIDHIYHIAMKDNIVPFVN